MLKTLRRNTKIVLWVVVASFVIGFVFIELGMGGFSFSEAKRARLRGVMGEVNGEAITDAEFQFVMNQMIERYRKEMNVEDVDPQTLKRIEEETWQKMLNDIIIRQEIHRRKIRITDEEIVSIIKNNPPQALLDNKDFQTNGQFDYNKYLSAISDARNLPWLNQYESFIRSAFPQEKLQEEIVGGLKVTDLETRNYFFSKNERVRVSYVYFKPLTPQNESEVTESEIKTFYEKHLNEYKVDERARAKYVFLYKKPSESDELNARKHIEEIHKRAIGNEDFGIIASESSEDLATSGKGGELGWVRQGQMVSEFEKAAFALSKEGDISSPVRSPFGWHIIQLQNIRFVNKIEERQLRHILIRVSPSEETILALRDKAREFFDLAKRKNFDEVAQDFGLKVNDSGLFFQNQLFPGTVYSREATNFCFNEKVGRISYPFESEEGFLIVKLVEKRGKGYKDLNEVSEEIKRRVIEEREKEKSRENAEEVLKEMKKTNDFFGVAKRNGLKVEKTEFFSREDYLPGIGIKNEFVGSAFALLGKGEISQVVQTEQGCYILMMEERVMPDLQKFSSEKDSLKKALLQLKKEQTFREWFQSLREKSKIRDYRGIESEG